MSERASPGPPSTRRIPSDPSARLHNSVRLGNLTKSPTMIYHFVAGAGDREKNVYYSP